MEDGETGVRGGAGETTDPLLDPSMLERPIEGSFGEVFFSSGL